MAVGPPRRLAVVDRLRPRLPPGAPAEVRDTLLVAAALVVLWQVLHEVAGDVALSSPAATVARLAEMMGDPGFWPHAAATAAAFGYALVLALLGGLAIGVALGGHRLAGEVAEPILVALYSIPKVTLYPVILLLFGLGMPAKVAFGTIHGIIPVALFTMGAVRHVRPVYLRAARAMRLSPWQTAATVLVPATVPEIATGFRIGFALTMLGVVIGELFASQHGLGFLVMRSINRHDVDTIMAVGLLLFLFATASGWLLLALDRRLHRRA